MIKLIKKIIPDIIKEGINLKLKFYKLNLNYKRQIKRIKKKKDKINVAFFLVNESIWKYEYLYFLMKGNKRYNPVVFICPYLFYGEGNMKQEMENTYQHFLQKGYNVKKTLNSDATWLDIKQSFQPDLVFFCTPYGLSLPQYHFENYLDTLTCYVPYGFNSSDLYNFHYNKEIQNFCWRYFVETSIHKKFAKKYSKQKGKNVIITGFPGMDGLLKQKKPNFEVWKNGDTKKKRIIWAPHHTIPDSTGSLKYKNHLNYSTFLDYADFMLEIAEKYENKIDFSFKPHPVLKDKLNMLWGEEKTTNYYKKWEALPNGQLDEGSYIDLFATSDAMIHDCGSFVIEYLYTGKPVLFLVSSEKVKEQFNEIGVDALKVLYQGHNQQEITNFIGSVVLQEKDEKREIRNAFYEQVVKPPNNALASENIYNHIIDQLK